MQILSSSWKESSPKGLTLSYDFVSGLHYDLALPDPNELRATLRLLMTCPGLVSTKDGEGSQPLHRAAAINESR